MRLSLTFRDSTGMDVVHQLRLVDSPSPSLADVLNTHQGLTQCQLVAVEDDSGPVPFGQLRAEPGGHHAVRLFLSLTRAGEVTRGRYRRVYAIAIPAPVGPVLSWARGFPEAPLPPEMEQWVDTVLPNLRTPANGALGGIRSVTVSIKARSPSGRPA